MPSGKERGSRSLKLRITGDFERQNSDAGDVAFIGRQKVLLSLAEFETLIVIVAETHGKPSPEFAINTIAKRVSRSPDTMYRRLRALNEAFKPLGRDLVEPMNGGWWQLTASDDAIDVNRERLRHHRLTSVQDAIARMDAADDPDRRAG